MFEEGNFSVNKTATSFSAVGVDHGIEQENRAMKVLGGIKGIANNQKALDQYFPNCVRNGKHHWNVLRDI